MAATYFDLATFDMEGRTSGDLRAWVVEELNAALAEQGFDIVLTEADVRVEAGAPDGNKLTAAVLVTAFFVGAASEAGKDTYDAGKQVIEVAIEHVLGNDGVTSGTPDEEGLEEVLRPLARREETVAAPKPRP